MQISSNTIVKVKLEFEDERFTARDPFEGTEVRAHELEIRGTSVWAKGPMYRSDGSPGTATRSVLIDAKDLPHQILADLFDAVMQELT